MNDINYYVSNDSGETFNQSTCPPGIAPAIESATQRGRTAGVCYGGGKRWSWALFDQAEDVLLEFTREDQVISSYAIKWSTWSAFQICAASREMTSREFLSYILATGIEEGKTVGEIIHFLFDESLTVPKTRRVE